MFWRAWYADSSTVAGRSFGEWLALPANGLVAFKLRDNGPKRVEHGNDAIYWDGIRLCSVNLPHPSLEREASVLAAEGLLKFGQEIPPEEWVKVSAEVAAELLED